MKEIMKREVIEEKDEELKAQPPFLLSEEEVVKRKTIKKDNEIEVGFEVLGIFQMVDDAEFGQKMFVRLGFEVYSMVLRMNDARVVFSTMMNNIRLTFSIADDN